MNVSDYEQEKQRLKTQPQKSRATSIPRCLERDRIGWGTKWGCGSTVQSAHSLNCPTKESWNNFKSPNTVLDMLQYCSFLCSLVCVQHFGQSTVWSVKRIKKRLCLHNNAKNRSDQNMVSISNYQTEIQKKKQKNVWIRPSFSPKFGRRLIVFIHHSYFLIAMMSERTRSCSLTTKLCGITDEMETERQIDEGRKREVLYLLLSAFMS